MKDQKTEQFREAIELARRVVAFIGYNKINTDAVSMDSIVKQYFRAQLMVVEALADSGTVRYALALAEGAKKSCICDVCGQMAHDAYCQTQHISDKRTPKTMLSDVAAAFSTLHGHETCLRQTRIFSESHLESLSTFPSGHEITAYKAFPVGVKNV
jgi:hypothetical protein